MFLFSESHVHFNRAFNSEFFGVRMAGLPEDSNIQPALC